MGSPETPLTLTELTDLGPILSFVVKTTCVYSDNGWVRFEGSQERLFLGHDCDFKVGEQVRITFDHA